MTSYPPAPPGPRPNADATTRIVCAVIGALALVVALVVVAATDRSADAGSAQSGGGVANAAPSGGLSADSGSGGGVSSTPSAAAPLARAAQLRANFPFPPGTQVWPGALVPTGAKAYQVPSKNLSLDAVKAFYTRRLPAVGVPVDHWGKDVGGPGGSIRGWGMVYLRQTDPKLYVAVQLDRLEVPGHVTIVVTVVCQLFSESTAC